MVKNKMKQKNATCKSVVIISIYWQKFCLFSSLNFIWPIPLQTWSGVWPELCMRLLPMIRSYVCIFKFAAIWALTCVVTSWGSGLRKDVINLCLEFALQVAFQSNACAMQIHILCECCTRPVQKKYFSAVHALLRALFGTCTLLPVKSWPSSPVFKRNTKVFVWNCLKHFVTAWQIVPCVQVWSWIAYLLLRPTLSGPSYTASTSQ